MKKSKQRIFIVDDNKIFRNAMTNFIENNENYILVGSASNGLECLEKIENRAVDIILMDINMPNLNGIETTKVINRINPNIPKIIALTQHDEFEYAKSMIEAGAKGYIVKSEVSKQLNEAIEKAMKGEYYYPNLKI